MMDVYLVKISLGFYFHMMLRYSMTNLSHSDKLAIIQHAISRFDSEKVLKEKLSGIMTEKEVERAVDTLIATQRVRRIGADTLQNNLSHTGELPELSEPLQNLVKGIQS